MNTAADIPLPKVTSIDSGAGFATTLVAGIMDRWGSDPIALSRITILTPTRRARRVLREAFLAASNGRPMLLPRMMPLGDVDTEELAFGDDLTVSGDDLAAEAIAPLERQLLLARLIRQAPQMSATPGQAVRLAAELARLIDAVWAERLDFARLNTLIPENYADHWQVTLDFLKIVTEFWPAILASRGRLDPADRRNRVMKAQLDGWLRNPPADPIIGAGSTGSLPATADLLAVVARLPQGVVVLPGLDREMDDESWQAACADDGHAQVGLSRLLIKLGVTREQVGDWYVPPPSPQTAIRDARRRLVAEALRPADTSQRWREVDPALIAGFTDLYRIDTETVEEEATVAALLLREVLETPGKSAALVTPDRAVAQRVRAQLRRWGVEADDSAGQPLSDTAVGSFLRLILRVMAENQHPLAVLALAKHPLTSNGTNAADCRNAARAVEKAIWRGPKMTGGFAGLRDTLADTAQDLFDSPEQREPLLAWAERLEVAFLPLIEAMREPEPTLPQLIRAHIRTAEALADASALPGHERLWRLDDGEAAAKFVNDLLNHADCFEAVPAYDYPAVLDALMSAVAVRPQRGGHPRISILGAMEARLFQADRMILTGLNEGTWPPDPAADPWMSRPMRQEFGLPSPERRISLSAHDFQQAMGATEVFIVRAAKVDGAPAVPSRWLQRLDTVARALQCPDWSVAVSKQYVGWARQLDQPESVVPAPRPAPNPPISARPRKLSVTWIETWMRNPYALYARWVLRLKPLDPIAAEPGVAERGQAIHAALDAFAKQYPRQLPTDAEQVLLELGEEAFAPLLARQPDVWAFWWPRFQRIVSWLVAVERERRPPALVLATEVNGQVTLDGPAGTFTLTAQADRIDRLGDGSLSIIDYKTGVAPNEAALTLGFAPQLPLEAAMAQRGGFAGVPGGPVGEIAFWKLSGAATPGEIITPKKLSVQELADQAWIGLDRLVHAFDQPDTPYLCRPRPEWAPRYDDYAHLARVAEWSGGDGEDEE